jgi:hypothetical protein
MRHVLVPFEHDWRRQTELHATEDTWPGFWAWLIDWPPDMFAVTSSLIEHGSLYRMMVSADPRTDRAGDDLISSGWPNQQEWLGEVRALSRAWRAHIESTYRTTTPGTDERLRSFFARCERLLRELVMSPHVDDAADPTTLSHLFALHAISDEACVGLGIPGGPNPSPNMAQDAELRLVDTGSLSRFEPTLVRVLPKLRTPQRGLMLRSFSHHVATTTSDVVVQWRPSPPPNYLADDDCERLELLVVPWPFNASDIEITPAPMTSDPALPPGWGYFDFDINATLDDAHLDMISRTIHAAEQRIGGPIHGLILPEAALIEEDFERLLDMLEQEELDVRFVLTGIRGRETNRARLQVLSYPPVDQDKHHRWCLEGGQIEQYSLHETLNRNRQWWEHIALPPRKLTIVPASGWLTMCHVICEDLARLDPIDQVIRAVAPTLLVALLQDGPQLRTRWPAKFATVYSDDPGCSVLTVTSAAMAARFTSPHVQGRQRVVALWSEPGGYPQELELAEGAKGLWLSIQAARVTEYTADGRSDDGWAARLVLRKHESVTPQ